LLSRILKFLTYFWYFSLLGGDDSDELDDDEFIEKSKKFSDSNKSWLKAAGDSDEVCWHYQAATG
jgi:hypothetical protein